MYKAFSHKFYSRLVYAIFFGCLIFLPACSFKEADPADIGSYEVLENMVVGRYALFNENTDLAHTEFSKAAVKISEVWADTTDAKKAGSLWYAENAKNFKGEPYERMMVFFYLGLLNIQKNDFGNAQAAFKQSLIQKSITDSTSNEQKRFDLSLILAGIALHKMGSYGPANDIFSEYVKLRGSLPFDKDKIPNLVVLVESGDAPIKKEDPTRKGVLIYKTSQEVPDQYDVLVKSLFLSTVEGSPDYVFEKDATNSMQEILYKHALDRGVREADIYGKKKELVKDGTGFMGKVLYDVGTYMLLNPDSDDDGEGIVVSSIVTLLGVASGLVSASIEVAADIRYWYNLPGNIEATFFFLEPGDYKVQISNQGSATPIFEKNLPIRDQEKLELVWFTN